MNDYYDARDEAVKLVAEARAIMDQVNLILEEVGRLNKDTREILKGLHYYSDFWLQYVADQGQGLSKEWEERP